MAVQVIGFVEAPQAGTQFEVYSSVQEARELADRRKRDAAMSSGTAGFAGVSLAEPGDRVMRLAIILKTDAQGSIAAVKHMFASMQNSEYINMRWILTAPGPISESDVDLASTCPADQKVLVLGFNSTVSEQVQILAKKKGVEVQNFKIIYELFDTVKAALTDEIGDEELETAKGTAECLAVFGGRYGNVCGCRVDTGVLRMGYRVKAFRNGAQVGQGNISSLRQGREEVQEVDTDTECGFSVEGWDEWKKGDEVRAYEVTMVQPDLVKQKSKKRELKSSQR
jgi:translation initiation factor IF-2